MVRLTDKFEQPIIEVVCIGTEARIISCKRKEQKFFLDKECTLGIDFRNQDVLPFKRKRGLFSNSRKYDVVFWEVGRSEALHLDKSSEWLPGLSYADTEKLIENLMLSLEANGRKGIKDWMFVCLLIPLIAIAVMVALNLFGVHFSASTAHQVIVQSTPSPSIPSVS